MHCPGGLGSILHKLREHQLLLFLVHNLLLLDVVLASVHRVLRIIILLLEAAVSGAFGDLAFMVLHDILFHLWEEDSVLDGIMHLLIEISLLVRIVGSVRHKVVSQLHPWVAARYINRRLDLMVLLRIAFEGLQLIASVSRVLLPVERLHACTLPLGEWRSVARMHHRRLHLHHLFR